MDSFSVVAIAGETPDLVRSLSAGGDLLPTFVLRSRPAMVQESTMQQERRQNVRVRPASDYDITIEFEEGLVRVRLAVVDLAIGGIGVLVDELFLGLPIGGEIKLKIELPAVEPFDTVAVLRHTT